MAILPCETIHACFVVIFQTHPSTRFVTGQLKFNCAVLADCSMTVNAVLEDCRRLHGEQKQT